MCCFLEMGFWDGQMETCIEKGIPLKTWFGCYLGPLEHRVPAPLLVGMLEMKLVFICSLSSCPMCCVDVGFSSAALVSRQDEA